MPTEKTDVDYILQEQNIRTRRRRLDLCQAVRSAGGSSMHRRFSSPLRHHNMNLGFSVSNECFSGYHHTFLLIEILHFQVL